MRSFDIDLHISEHGTGWMLYCFEGDDCIWEEFYRDRAKAEARGNKFLTGAFVEGFYEFS